MACAALQGFLKEALALVSLVRVRVSGKRFLGRNELKRLAGKAVQVHPSQIYVQTETTTANDPSRSGPT
jgi:hypothetical protein